MGFAACAGVIVFGLVVGASALGGPVTPPAGPVSGTHKTLSEVEPRTAVNAVNTPGDADSVFKIMQPGSYYLTGNVTGLAGRHGIEIAASHVTLDLNGFSLQGAAGSLSGVVNSVSTLNVSVRNGSVSGWGQTGVNLNALGAGNGSRVEGISSSSNGADGISVPIGTIVRWCVAHNNADAGFRCGEAGSFLDCISRNNGGDGFVLGTSGLVMQCEARLNDGNGFAALVSAMFVACESTSNAVGFSAVSYSMFQSCRAHGNDGRGIDAGISAHVWDCTAALNSADGIAVSSDSLILANRCDSNGFGGDGAGILLTGSDCYVTDNLCVDSDRGIDVNSTGNFIARNVCSGNATNWDVAANNVCFVLDAALSGAILGDSGGVSPGSTSAWANYSF